MDVRVLLFHTAQLVDSWRSRGKLCSLCSFQVPTNRQEKRTPLKLSVVGAGQFRKVQPNSEGVLISMSSYLEFIWVTMLMHHWKVFICFWHRHVKDQATLFGEHLYINGYDRSFYISVIIKQSNESMNAFSELILLNCIVGVVKVWLFLKAYPSCLTFNKTNPDCGTGWHFPSLS